MLLPGVFGPQATGKGIFPCMGKSSFSCGKRSSGVGKLDLLAVSKKSNMRGGKEGNFV
jgi:hypothetical protein